METLWAAERNFLKHYLETIENATAEEKAQARNADFSAAELSDIMAIKGESATIIIQGVLTPEGPSAFAKFFGFTGTSTNLIRAAAEKLAADDSVKHVTLRMDTPGGTVTGTDETLQALAQLRTSGKIITAENHGMIASAGIWIAMAANEIKAMSPTVETGSIGVIVAGFDFSEWMKKAGIKQVVITSKHAPNKFASIQTKEGIAILQRRIDKIENVFIARVADGRSVSVKKVIKDFGAGGVLIAEIAQSVGLIDSVVAPIGQAVANPKDKHKTKTQTDEDGKMNLTEFLAENPSAKIEVDAIKNEAFAAGQAEEKSKIDVRIKVAKPILESKDYPDAITGMATKVIAGEVSADSLTSTVVMWDAHKEQDAANAAAEEADKLKDTPPAEPSSGDGDEGIMNSEKAMQAQLAKDKGVEPRKVAE